MPCFRDLGLIGLVVLVRYASLLRNTDTGKWGNTHKARWLYMLRRIRGIPVLRPGPWIKKKGAGDLSGAGAKT